MRSISRQLTSQSSRDTTYETQPDEGVLPSIAREGEAGICRATVVPAQARLETAQLLSFEEAILVDVQHSVEQVDFVCVHL